MAKAPLHTFFISAICCWVLISCSAIGPSQRTTNLPLIPPDSLKENWQVLQRIRIRHPHIKDPSAQQSLLVAWSKQNEQLTAITMTVTGHPLIKLVYDGNTITEEFSDSVPERLKRRLNGQTLLSQLQLGHWPAKLLRQHYATHGYTLTIDDKTRLVSDPKHAVYRIDFKNTQTERRTFDVIDYTTHMEITVETLQFNPLK